MAPYMICNVVFVVFWVTVLKPTAESCSVDPKIYHPAKRSLAICEHTGGVLGDFVVVFHRDIYREHSLIGRRNYLITEICEIAFSRRGPEIAES